MVELRENNFKKILQDFRNGEINEETVLKYLLRENKLDYIEKISNLANLDVFRGDRTGIPEVIFGQSKTTDVLIEIVKKFLNTKDQVLVSRILEEQYPKLIKFVEDQKGLNIFINKHGKIAKIYKTVGKSADKIDKKKGLIRGKIGLITAGTSDIPVAEEAKLVAEEMGCEVITSYDVGIAGFHRIFKPLKNMLLAGVNAIIVVAGMEGTLPGVVSALVDVPVVGVPTSSGYGHGGSGEGALTTMLQSCSPGLTVVNIDNGFGAGASAGLIAISGNRSEKKNIKE
ncbi:MAG: nickel pincer cofactor biosynthesis protein LarB [Promethearchaeota archaeon]